MNKGFYENEKKAYARLVEEYKLAIDSNDTDKEDEVWTEMRELSEKMIAIVSDIAIILLRDKELTVSNKNLAIGYACFACGVDLDNDFHQFDYCDVLENILRHYM